MIPLFSNISEKISKTKHLNEDDDNGLVTMIGAGELFHICVTVCVLVCVHKCG